MPGSWNRANTPRHGCLLGTGSTCLDGLLDRIRAKLLSWEIEPLQALDHPAQRVLEAPLERAPRHMLGRQRSDRLLPAAVAAAVPPPIQAVLPPRGAVSEPEPEAALLLLGAASSSVELGGSAGCGSAGIMVPRGNAQTGRRRRVMSVSGSQCGWGWKKGELRVHRCRSTPAAARADVALCWRSQLALHGWAGAGSEGGACAARAAANLHRQYAAAASPAPTDVTLVSVWSRSHAIGCQQLI